MGQKLPPEQLALYRKIDELLWRQWDPIGVSVASGIRDEYYAYLPHVFRLAMDGASVRRIAAYLLSVETQRMGLRGSRSHCVKVATAILDEKESLGL